MGGRRVQGKQLEFSAAAVLERVHGLGSEKRVGGKGSAPQREVPRLSLCVLRKPAPAAFIPPGLHPARQPGGGSVCCWAGLSVDLNQGNPTGCNLQPLLDSVSEHSDLMEGTGTIGLMMGLQYCQAGITLLRWIGPTEPS